MADRVQVTTYVDRATADALCALAAEREQTLAALLRLAIRELLRKGLRDGR